MKNKISLSAIEKIAKKSGAKRISKDGLVKLRDLAEDYTAKISKDAVRMAKHAGRKTVRGEDISV